MFWDWIFNFALQKKKGAIKNTLSKKKEGQKKGAKKKRPFYFEGRKKKKMKGNALFLEVNF